MTEQEISDCKVSRIKIILMKFCKSQKIMDFSAYIVLEAGL